MHHSLRININATLVYRVFQIKGTVAGRIDWPDEPAYANIMERTREKQISAK